MTNLKQLDFQLKGATPDDSNRLVTKDVLNQYYWIDNTAAGLDSYPGNRIITDANLAYATSALPDKPFYQMDVTRYSIPGATGAYFNYIGADFQTYKVLQNTYGYVGRYCMQDLSWQNNQWNVYSISQVGICFPNYGTTYPQPYISGGSLYFTGVYGYHVEDVIIYQSILYNAYKDSKNLNLIAALYNFFVTIEGWLLYGTGELRRTNSVRYSSTGSYTNGSVYIPSINKTDASGENKYFVAYKVKDNYGNTIFVYGFQSGANSKPPGFSL